MTRLLCSALAALIVFALPTASYGQDPAHHAAASAAGSQGSDPPAHGEATHGSADAGAQVPHHPEFRNEFMLFVGDTRKGGANEFTVGFDYLRSLGHHWGVGIFLDYASGTFEREYIAGLAAFWAPFPFAPDLHLLVGGGWERLDENVPHHHAHEHHESHVDSDFDDMWEHDNLLIARLGGSYLLHFGAEGRFVLAPQAFYDVVQGRGRDAVVFGIGFGYLF